ncbi:MAG TPA: porin [Solimonas sp.]|nr:porin [Solimonas sp.]
MQKSLWAAAITAALAFPAHAVEVDASLYGDFRFSYGYFDTDGGDTDGDLDNNNSHVGLRVLTRGEGLSVFAQYERLADNDNGTSDGELTRQFFGGVTGPWGTLSYGRQATAYKLSGQKLDPFYNTSVAGITGAAGITTGAGYGLSALTNDGVGNGFINNQVAFVSAPVAGLRVNAAVFTDEGAGDAEEGDYAAGAEWSAEGATVGVQALDLNTGRTAGSVQNFAAIGLPGPAGELEAVRAYAAYAAPGWGLGASFEKLNLRAGLDDREYAFASGWYGLNDRLRLAASVGHTQNTPFEGIAYTLGASYTVIENLNVYAAARSVDREEDAAQPDDTTSYALGVSYRFDVGLN